MSKKHLLGLSIATVGSFEIDGETYYIKEETVAEVNQRIFGTRIRAIKVAKEQGIELDLTDTDTVSQYIDNTYNPYIIAIPFASRVCDKDGNLLFDVNSEDDLKAVANLPARVLTAFEKATMEGIEKNSRVVDDSK